MDRHSLCGLAEVTFINDSADGVSGTVSGSTELVQRRELKGIRSGVENTAFACHVVVNLKPDCFTVSSA